ncbi:MAG: phenylacetate--CoA ligase family protein [Vicinamibacterales bacterium]|jgi:phenylacetate-coenzyme A ligase PaaK-like adenylate-forming protein
MSSEHFVALLRDARRARREGPDAIAQRQRTRLAGIVAHARAHSPYFRELYKGLPDRVEDPMLLPVTDKKQLMVRFDDWVTDRAVTIEDVHAFIGNPALIGDRFLDMYTVLTTSGTTGTPGIFVLDDRTMSVTSALAVCMGRAWLAGTDILKVITRGGRMTMICATGGHYAEAVIGARLRKRRGDNAVQVLSANAPLPTIVADLNRFRPALLAPYASLGALLAGEQAAGRLRISPALVVLSAEGLPAGGYDRIAKAFNAKVQYSYAATECTFLSANCEYGWLHVNSDWVVLEPVGVDYRPTPPGTLSHTVLISNLANRVQPILRYDLGDRILQRPDPCPCGNRLPAIRVEGRTADILTFSTGHGEQVSIPALMFEVVDAMGVELFQILQTMPVSLRVRLRPAAGADPDRVWQAVHSEITRVLAQHGLDHVTVERAEEPPAQSSGGKYRAIIPLASTST